MEAGFLAMPSIPPRPGGSAPFLLLFGAAFGAYALAVRLALRPQPAPGAAGRRLDAIVLAFAVLFRASLIGAAPALSDDLLRYLWDGRVVAAGLNPYSDPPASESLAPLREAPFETLPHADVRTIYPPAAQAIFASAALLGWGAPGLKILLVVADLAGIVLLRRILRRRGLPEARVLIYAWNPLAVIEVAWSGHLEAAGILCVLAASAAIIQKRDLRSVAFLTLGGLVKILPLALLLPFFRAVRWRALLLVPALLAAAFWPFRSAGWSLLSGLRAYAGRWSANESLFGIVRALVVALDPTPSLKAAIAFLRARVPGSEPLDLLYAYVYPEDLARGLCAGAALAAAAVVARRVADPLRGAFYVTGTILLLSPTLHPWYLLWILPWLCLEPSRAWILLSGLAVLAYAEAGPPAAGGRSLWPRLVEYVPFYAVLLADALRARRGGRQVWGGGRG